MIKLFSGQDEYQSYESAKLEAEKVSSSLGFDLQIIDSESIQNIEDLVQDFDGIGMFSKGSVLLLKRVFANKKVVDYLAENYSKLKDQNLILWSDGNADGRSKFTQILKKDGLLFQYDLPNERDFKIWVKQELKGLNLKLGDYEVEYLIQSIGINKYMLKSELKKIHLFSTNKQTPITLDDLKIILGFESRGNIWTFLDGFGNRRKKDSLKEFIKLTEYEENTQYIIAMLERELSILSQIKFCDVNKVDMRELKLHPFVLKKSVDKARKFKWPEIKFFIEKLMNLDFAIKTGDIDEKLAMTLYILSI